MILTLGCLGRGDDDPDPPAAAPTTPDDDGFRPTAEWTVTGQLNAAGTTMTAGNGPFYLRCAPAR